MRAIQNDTRQKEGKHTIKEQWWEGEGYPTVRSKVAFGDYCLTPSVSVDTKQDIYELAMDITADHERFRRELIAAQQAECKLYILVETNQVENLAELAEWEEPKAHLIMRRRRSGKAKQYKGLTLAKACTTLERKYGVTFLFCTPDESAKLIADILYKE